MMQGVLRRAPTILYSTTGEGRFENKHNVVYLLGVKGQGPEAGSESWRASLTSSPDTIPFHPGNEFQMAGGNIKTDGRGVGWLVRTIESVTMPTPQIDE